MCYFLGMNYKTISIKEARNRFSEIIEKAALVGDSFLVTKFGKPKALIISADVLAEKKTSKLQVLAETAGLWADRKEIVNSAVWIAKKRQKESSRHGKIFS